MIKSSAYATQGYNIAILSIIGLMQRLNILIEAAPPYVTPHRSWPVSLEYLIFSMLIISVVILRDHPFSLPICSINLYDTESKALLISIFNSKYPFVTYCFANTRHFD